MPFCDHIQFDHHNFFYITQLAIVLNPVHLVCTGGLLAAAMVAVSTYHPPTHHHRPPFFRAHLLPILRGPGTNNKLICTTKPPTITKGCPKPTINQKTSTMHPQFSMPQAHKARWFPQKSHIWHHHTQALPRRDFTGPQGIRFLYYLGAPLDGVSKMSQDMWFSQKFYHISGTGSPTD